MEVQMTDFENAAFSVFVVLLTRAILSFNLNFYVPISKVRHYVWLKPRMVLTIYSQVDENMSRAQQRDASRSQKFYFRKDVLPPGHISPTASSASSSGNSSPVDCGCSGEREFKRKESKMRNCFPSLPRPLNGVQRGPVENEYEEMTMEEIICGKVSFSLVIHDFWI